MCSNDEGWWMMYIYSVCQHHLTSNYPHLPSSTHKHFQSCHIPRRFPSPAASLLLDQPCSFRSRSRCSRCSRSRSLPLRISRCSFSGVVAFSAASWSHGRWEPRETVGGKWRETLGNSSDSSGILSVLSSNSTKLSGCQFLCLEA